MINHRGGILVFGQIFDFGKNRKFEILNPSENRNLRSLTLTPNLDLNKIFVILIIKILKFEEKNL